jgi:transcriptional regulator with XRE-family HTH domain
MTATKTEERRRLIPRYLDEQMGLPILLIESAYEVETNGASGIVVPDIPGLGAAIAVARVMNDFKLNGQEIRFLRRAIGIKGNKLASDLDVTPETVSRWENGKETITTNVERVLRLQIYKALRDKAPGVTASMDIILEMKLRHLRLTNEGPMAFRYVAAIWSGRPRLEQVWFYEGLSTAASSSEQKMRA